MNKSEKKELETMRELLKPVVTAWKSPDDPGYGEPSQSTILWDKWPELAGPLSKLMAEFYTIDLEPEELDELKKNTENR